MSYDLNAIARELDQTASGYSYHGNALYVARDLPELSREDKLCLTRWLLGANTAIDGLHLQDIAIKLRESE